MKTFLVIFLATLAVLVALFTFANRERLGEILKNKLPKAELNATPVPLPTPEIVSTTTLSTSPSPRATNTATKSGQPTATRSAKPSTLPTTGFPVAGYVVVSLMIGAAGVAFRKNG